MTPARRQVLEVLKQAAKNAAPGGFFGAFAKGAQLDSADTAASAVARDLNRGADMAAAAYGAFADFLSDELAPAATEADAVGRDIYALQSRRFLGATIDLDETYEWGIGELARMVDEQEAIGREIKPGASVAEAIEFLDADESRKLHGTDALQRWMQRRATGPSRSWVAATSTSPPRFAPSSA